MKTYRIPVFWSVGAVIPIKAVSLEEAIKKAKTHEDPRAAIDECYVEGSFVVNAEEARISND